MNNKKNIVYPYMPNSVEHIKKEMMDELGIKSIEELYSYIPKHLRAPEKMNLPEPLLSEIELKEHVEGILSKNTSCSENISFLGAGCYRHYVPVICDEINSRSEFLTAYCGETYADHGKCQAIFEFTSLMGELVDMDVVGLATYDGGQATCTSLRMTNRITGRKELLVPKTMNPEILLQLRNFCDFMTITEVDYNPKTGQMDLNDLKNKISDNTAGVFIENPSYLGFIEEHGEEIGRIAHENGAVFVVSADPSSLGILEAPVNYGADVTCGDIQCLGMHMGYGSGQSGYIASKDDPKFIMNFPNHFYSLYENDRGEFGFSRSLNQRTSYGVREKAVEYLGTNTGLWAITAAVYLSLMGPEGMYELGKNIMYKAKYASKVLSEVKGVKVVFNGSTSFKEFILNFDESNKSVEKINKELLKKGIFGGKNISKEFKELGNSALYCVTELTKKSDIDRLVKELSDILK
ncbi:aminomethyl-transferring glycine dehydrogenase subunit GcvPA [Proteiniborus sp. MB09-C3]|uniref:aminomethyl-transferring glycine dehydrogenase subunit GcvPA n=1 Tax=Proteiniborus sp. MB09-C3 TaxID=3050072 RepID=UPI0025528B86|nr:aminomethyl-transferring glycine dehydrogenase subunit GcvPA [Proteiniborus sp. MB09-C3]WIV13061.1 aminomethyl-transferring glycine dehydrogenase subunit GcvPA [Proteiniborus sp. MB09-C3]